jgi:hypothetical protein
MFGRSDPDDQTGDCRKIGFLPEGTTNDQEIAVMACAPLLELLADVPGFLSVPRAA